jgi:predicted RNA-binding Zn-ribbon protein involved in translation (DUF1610 family)
MSLPQLIGLECVTCQKSISSLTDGGFCPDCGNPVHRKCIGSVHHAAEDRCPLCGGDFDSAVAQEVQRERDAQDQSAATPAVNSSLSDPAPTAFPVSETCPKCAGAQFTRVPPQSMVAFAKDRVCTQCGTRYTPPTPLWAALVFILLGVFFLGGSIGNVLVMDNPRIFGTIFGAVIGVSALVLGIRSFIKPGKV